jgi:transcriptional regulator with XRE-family HTH domain
MPIHTLPPIAERVRQICALRGKSLSALSRESGVSKSALFALLTGETPQLRTVLRLARALDVQPGALLDAEVAP